VRGTANVKQMRAKRASQWETARQVERGTKSERAKQNEAGECDGAACVRRVRHGATTCVEV